MHRHFGRRRHRPAPGYSSAPSCMSDVTHQTLALCVLVDLAVAATTMAGALVLAARKTRRVRRRVVRLVKAVAEDVTPVRHVEEQQPWFPDAMRHRRSQEEARRGGPPVRHSRFAKKEMQLGDNVEGKELAGDSLPRCRGPPSVGRREQNALSIRGK